MKTFNQFILEAVIPFKDSVKFIKEFKAIFPNPNSIVTSETIEKEIILKNKVNKTSGQKIISASTKFLRKNSAKVSEWLTAFNNIDG